MGKIPGLARNTNDSCPVLIKTRAHSLPRDRRSPGPLGWGVRPNGPAGSPEDPLVSPNPVGDAAQEGRVALGVSSVHQQGSLLSPPAVALLCPDGLGATERTRGGALTLGLQRQGPAEEDPGSEGGSIMGPGGGSSSCEHRGGSGES